MFIIIQLPAPGDRSVQALPTVAHLHSLGSGGDAGARRSSCLFQEQVFVYFSASIRRSNLPESNLGTRTRCSAGDWADGVPTQRVGKEVSTGSRSFCLFFFLVLVFWFFGFLGEKGKSDLYLR
jgi:hypothetical protein